MEGIFRCRHPKYAQPRLAADGMGARHQEEEAANNAAWKSPIEDLFGMCDFELIGPASFRVGKVDSDDEEEYAREDAQEVPEDRARCPPPVRPAFTRMLVVPLLRAGYG